jgi:hypothetical protein
MDTAASPMATIEQTGLYRAVAIDRAGLLSRWTAEMNFAVQPGPSNVIRFPKWGPYDERLVLRGIVEEVGLH